MILSHQSYIFGKYQLVIPGILVLACLYIVSLYNYLLFHSLSEIFSIVIYLAIFFISWNARKLLTNHFLLFIGIAFLFIGGLDTLHTLAYKNMGVFETGNANTPIQLWISSRFIQSISLLLSPLFIRRKINILFTFVIFISVTLIILASIFYWHSFPVCFVDGIGLTTFKKTSEYVICLILIGAVCHFYLKRDLFAKNILWLLIFSLAFAIQSEFAFTLYSSAFSLSNLIGHLLKIISVYFLYKAIVQTGLTEPYKLLFKELKSSENAFQESEKKLEKKEKQYRELYEKAPLPYQSLNWNGKVLDVNKAWLEILGYTKEEVVGKSFGNFLLPDWQEHFEYNFPRFKEKGEVLGVEFEMVKKDGTAILVSFNGRIAHDEQGNFVQTHCIFRDITEQRKIEEKLKASHQECSAAMDASDDAIYLLDTSRHLLRANKTFFLMTRSTPEKAIGIHITHIVHPEGEETPCPVCLAQEEKRDAVIIMEPGDPDNPTSRPIEITVTIAKDVQGKPLSILMRLHDLTSQRKVETELLKSKDEWERTFNSIPDVVSLQDTSMRILKINRAGCDTLGLGCDTITGHYCYELFHGSSGPCPECPLLETKNTFKPCTKEMTHEKLGKTFLVSASPVLNEQGELTQIAHVAKDVTEMKKIEERLFLNEKMSTIAGLAAGVAHEINTPLSAILQSQQMMEMRLSPDTPRNQEVATECGVDLTKVDTYFKQREIDVFIKGMRESAINASNIIKNLLEFSRPHKGDILPTDLTKLLDNTLQLARADYSLKKQYDIINVDIRKEFAPDLAKVPCVPMELEQVILNLIKNAVHAMADNNTPDPTITVRTSRADQTARIEIEDNGPGIDKETSQHIFDPFFTTKEVGLGTGLGLSVSHAIVHNKHKGNIWVETEPGKGATFIIELPLRSG